MTRYLAWLGPIVVALALAGCSALPPIEPTLAIPSTATPTIVPTATAKASPTIATLPPSWTPAPSKTSAPSATSLPTDTPPPATATRDINADAPLIVTSNGQGALTFTLTAAQLNAALAKRFDAAPFFGYTAAPRVAMDSGALNMTLRIIPDKAPSGTGAQTIMLTANLLINSGALEVQPVHLAPLDVGILTKQVKPAQALLLQTLDDTVREVAGSPRVLTYNYIGVGLEGISVTVVAER